MDWHEMTTSELIGYLTPTPRHCDLVMSYEMLFEIDRRRRGDPAPPPAAPSDHHYTHDATAGIDEPSSQDDAADDAEDEDGDDDEVEEDEDLDEEDFEDGGRGGMMDYREAYRNGGFGGVPASAAAIADLIRKCKYHETEGGRGGDDAAHREAARGCIICIEDFEAGDDLGVMPCSHMFHHDCLAEWLSYSRFCPCCRHALPSEAQD